jgi:hypothetical protein
MLSEWEQREHEGEPEPAWPHEPPEPGLPGIPDVPWPPPEGPDLPGDPDVPWPPPDEPAGTVSSTWAVQGSNLRPWD